MKQRISAEQLAKLTPEQKTNLRERWKPQCHDLFVVWNEGYSQWLGEGLLSVAGVNDVYAKDDHYCELSIGAFNFFRGENKFRKDNCLPLLSIGQMMELLDSKDELVEVLPPDAFFDAENICKRLWQAVKSVL